MFRITRSTLATAFALAALALAGTGRPAEAQFGRRLKDAIKHNAEDRVIQKAVREGEQGDRRRDRVGGSKATGGAAAPAPCAGAPAEPRRTAAPTVATAIARADSSSRARRRGPTTTSSRVSAILFADEFSGDEVGDFPRRMEFKAGSLEIVEWQGTRLLRANSGLPQFIPMMPRRLPEPVHDGVRLFSIPTGGEVWIYVQGREQRLLQFGGDGTAVVLQLARTACGRTAGWPRPSAAPHGSARPRAGGRRST